MSKDEMRVFATIRVKPEYFEEARIAVLEIIPQTLKEEGCVMFDLHDSTEEPNTLFLYEVWKDRVAFDFHHEQDYTKNVFRKYEDWLAEPATLLQIQKIS